MDKWRGAAAVCINEENELLMVLQGKSQEKQTWTVPSGGIEEGETPEQCCRRETYEETGYTLRIEERLKTKNGYIGHTAVEVIYFSVIVIGGQMKIQDPDRLIHEIRWVSYGELAGMELAFPEDRLFLMDTLTNNWEGADRT